MTVSAPALDTLVDPTRLAALAAYDILDTAPEKDFDDIVLLARNNCENPVALVSLVAGDRQWFKARLGFPECGTDLNASVCAHALVEPDLLVIPDLSRDPRTRATPRSPVGPASGSTQARPFARRAARRWGASASSTSLRRWSYAARWPSSGVCSTGARS